MNSKTVPDLQKINPQTVVDEIAAELAKTQYALWKEIDRRRKVEQSLRELEEMHYRILEAANCGILISARDGKLIKTNSCFQKITGYSADELQAKGFLSLMPNPEHRQKLIKVFNTLEPVEDWEIPIRCKDDTLRFTVLNIYGTELAGQPVVVTRVEDISTWKQSETKLKESMDYQNQILNHVGDPVFVQNRKHLIVLVNDAFCEFTRKTRQDLLGTTGYRYMTQEQATDIFEQDEEIFRTGRGSVSENRITDYAGNTRTLVTKKTLLVTRDGQKQIVSVLRDVTEQKHLEAQFL